MQPKDSETTEAHQIISSEINENQNKHTSAETLE